MRSRQQRERTKPGDGNRTNSAAVVFNGDVGEDVETAITDMKSKIGTEGLGYLFDGVSPHREERMPCENPGYRPKQRPTRRLAWENQPEPGKGSAISSTRITAKESEESTKKVSTEEAEESAVKLEKYMAKVAASVQESGVPKRQGQEGYLSPSSLRRAKKKCNRYRRIGLQFEAETPARTAQEATGTPAARRASNDDSIRMRTADFGDDHGSDEDIDYAIKFSEEVAQWETKREDYLLAKKCNDAMDARCRTWDKDMNKAWYLVQAMLGPAPQRVTAPAAAGGRYDIGQAFDLLREKYHAKSNLGVVQRVLEYILTEWDHDLDDIQNVEAFNRRTERITKPPDLGGVGDKVTMADLASALWIRNLGDVSHHKSHRQALLRDDISDLGEAQQKLINEHAADRIGGNAPRGGGGKGRGAGRDRARGRRGDRPGRDQEEELNSYEDKRQCTNCGADKHEADRCYKKGGGWWKRSHQYLAEQAAANKGAGRKGADKNNRSNVKGIAKEVIALLRGGGDTSDDSDDEGSDEIQLEPSGRRAKGGKRKANGGSYIQMKGRADRVPLIWKNNSWILRIHINQMKESKLTRQRRNHRTQAA